MKTISQLIKDLENIKDRHGDLPCYHDRWGGLEDASIQLAYTRLPQNKREIFKFWSDCYKEDTKNKPCVRVW